MNELINNGMAWYGMLLASSLPILVFLGLSFLVLTPIYATDRQKAHLK